MKTELQKLRNIGKLKKQVFVVSSKSAIFNYKTPWKFKHKAK